MLRRLADLFRLPTTYVCVWHHLVTCTYLMPKSEIPANVFSALVETVDESGRVQRRHQQIWPTPTFTRDDIDDPMVLNGLKHLMVSQEERRYFRAVETRLTSQGLKLIVITPDGANGFLAGYTDDLDAAVRFVALGDRDALSVPWKEKK